MANRKHLPLTPQERYIGTKCALLTKTNYDYDVTTKKMNMQVLNRNLGTVRKLMESRRKRPSYTSTMEFAKKLRTEIGEQRTALDIVNAVNAGSRFWGGVNAWDLLRFCDAELDVAGLSDQEVEKLLLVEAL